MVSYLYKIFFSTGHILGCHQRADRSFFLHGKQFPVCARCTGVLFGECIALVTFHLFHPPIPLLILFPLIMFLDWLIQFLKIRESTNIRRLITGTLCGYAFCTWFLDILLMIKHFT